MKKTILAITAAAALAACGKEQPAPQAPTTPPSAGANVAEGYAKKDTYFRLPGASGGEIDLAAYSGKPVLVMFFTETCPYCRKAGPFIQKVYTSYGPKGLGVVGICVQDSSRAALNFAKDLGVTFPLAYNGGEVSRKYRTQGVPYIYLLNARHEIYDVWEGYDAQYDQPIISAVEKLLPKK
ncbi:MAG: TlpA disulfide reductase family protein [Elusimicrobia bacterium]|nr:TlpA disulfide reductase family protein [Elusimicrobiota bacterium]